MTWRYTSVRVADRSLERFGGEPVYQISPGWNDCDPSTEQGIAQLAERHTQAAAIMFERFATVRPLYTAYCTKGLVTRERERYTVHLSPDRSSEIAKVRTLLAQCCDLGEALAVVTLADARMVDSKSIPPEGVEQWREGVEQWRATHGGISEHPQAIETAVLAIESRLGNVLLLSQVLREGTGRTLGPWEPVEAGCVHSGLFGLLPDSWRLTQMPSVQCVCGHRLECAAALGHGMRPAPGDFSICGICSRILRFEADYSVREAQPGELSTLRPEFRDRVIAAQASVRQHNLPGKPGRGLA